MAGIPVYSQAGRGGGWSLVGGARTDLSGLTAAEARTLFLVAGPSAAATPQIKAALRKLVRALPEPFRAEAEAAASAVVLDPTSWDRTSVPPPEHLEVLQRAVVDGVQVRLRYAGRDRPESERIVHPLGLVAKASVWYLVARDRRRAAHVPASAASASVAVTDEPAERPEGFDLAETWRSIVDDDRRASGAVQGGRARRPEMPCGGCDRILGARLSVGDAVDGRARRGGDPELVGPHGRRRSSRRSAPGSRSSIPPEVREELARLGAELTELYGPSPDAPQPKG